MNLRISVPRTQPRLLPENENSLDQDSSSLQFMSQGPDPSNNLSTTASEDALSQSINSHTFNALLIYPSVWSTYSRVSLIVMPAYGSTARAADNTMIVDRIDNKLHLDVTVLGLPHKGCFIRVPLTRFVKQSVSPTMTLALNGIGVQEANG
jgi:hypothetical protein